MLTGSIVMFAGSVAPQGWLICDGSAVSRTTYSNLFDVIDTTYGYGDGDTTFNIPDLRGRVLIGSSANHPTASNGGEEEHILIEKELPLHLHTVGQHGHANGITITTPVLSHSITQAAFKYSAPGGSTKGTSSYAGPAFNGTTSTNATRSTDVAVSAHNSVSCTVSGSITDCSAFNTDSIGLGNSHNNMQPFITMNYIIYTGE